MIWLLACATPEPVEDPGSPADTGGALPCVPSSPIVVFATRHAEKEDTGDDPGLTEEGLARAEALAERMRDEPLAAIYATDLVRTQQTVAPTAADHDLSVIVVPDLDAEDVLAATLCATHAGETVLHAGHSYTLPDFAEALGAEPVLVDGYGQLWTITVGTDGVAAVVEERYGA
ncbi:MAG: histidine phosphatase family protein [Myxococcota bacterium]